MPELSVDSNIEKNKYDENLTISTEKKKEIENKVSEILKKKFKSKQPFIDIISIVQNDGFDVQKREMDIETTGCLFIDNANKWNPKKEIWVNTTFKNPDDEDDVVFKKSRFITAHEYGHFVLHHSIKAHRDTYHRTEEPELEADYFARSILMPLNYFKDCYTVAYDFFKGDMNATVDILSRFFRVTRRKVIRRINDLSELSKCEVDKCST